MEKISAAEVNRRFISYINQKEEGWREKTAEAGETYLERTLLERGFTRKCLPPGEPIGPEHNQVIRRNNGLVFQIDLDSKHEAMVVAFGSMPEAKWISGEYAEIPFFVISSPLIEYHEEELLAQYKPVGRIIEDDMAAYLETVEDEVFISLLEAIITANPAQQVLATGIVNKTHLAAACANLVQRNLKPAKFLLSLATYWDIVGLDQTQLGSDGTWETFRDGYKHDKLIGIDYILTLKHDLVPKGVVWCLADQAHLGVMKIMRTPRFFVNEMLGTIQMMAREMVCIGVEITNGVTKLVVTPEEA